MKMTLNQVLTGSALATALIFSSAAMARGGDDGGDNGGDGSGFAQLFSEASSNGSCRVNRVSGTGATFYVPSGGSGRYNILGWGNGTGGTSTTYSALLETIASHCVLVAAANTSSSGDGTDVRDAVNDARLRYGSILNSDPKVCTSGHSQGGGGSFNAANLLNADCVIAVQADTRFTTRISDALDSDVEVIALWGSSDTLAPRSGNLANVRNNSSIMTSVETSGESHFAPTSGRGGDIGTMFRMAAKAQLSSDAAEAQRFRRAFWGPTTSDTVTEANSNISDVERDAAALATQP
jgi:hypothetical protein